MNGIFVVMEQHGGLLDEASWEIVEHGRSLAEKLNQKLCGVIMGSGIAKLAENLDQSGLDEICLI
ncbi:MAG TPA: electron transfer flavoprotein subunit alpha, partial [Desulfobacterales bacterium]|nr:electron transfer flavoprotein subunit alpha [Desulfobacterales bacterium]